MTSGFHLAQFNTARAKGPVDDESPDAVMAEFMANLDPINALADSAPGFVWRHQDESGNSTSVQVFDDPDILINFSVWQDYESFHHYVFKTDHVAFMRRRAEWFEPIADLPVTVLWWVPAGTIPSVAEAIDKLNHLAEHGPTPEAFNFRTRFDPPQ